MRVLFATTRGAGHFTPLVPLARACLRAGHDVLVAGPASVAPLARHAGLPFEAVGELDDAAADAAFAPVFGPRAAAPDAAFVISELFGRLFTRSALGDTLELVRRRRPDVIVRETMEFASALAAERFGVCQVRFGIHLEAVLDGNAGPLGLAAPVLAELRSAAGLDDGDPLAAIRASPLLTLAPASLDVPDAPAVRRFRDPERSGRANGAPVWPGADERPLVLVGFGSETARSAYFPGAYRDAIESLAGLPVRVLLALGHRRRPEELGAVPGSVRVVDWVPLAAGLREAAVMVGHGGSGSTLHALAAGVPQVMLGLFVDGPRNAARVAELGAGVAVESAGEIGGAVRDVLDSDARRAGAAAVAAEIAALPPIDDAVAALA